MSRLGDLDELRHVGPLGHLDELGHVVKLGHLSHFCSRACLTLITNLCVCCN